jgi:hypothetical protein
MILNSAPHRVHNLCAVGTVSHARHTFEAQSPDSYGHMYVTCPGYHEHDDDDAGAYVAHTVMQSYLPNDGLGIYNVTLYCGRIVEWSNPVDSNDEVRVWEDGAATDGIKCNGCEYAKATEAPSAYLTDEALNSLAAEIESDGPNYDIVTCVGWSQATVKETDSDVACYRENGETIGHCAARTIAAWYQSPSTRGSIFAAFASGNPVYADVLIMACRDEAFRAPTATVLNLYALIGYAQATRS